MARSLVRDLAALTAREWDLCVVGGGVTGLCVAYDAAARGLSVALLERGDFAEGTSSATTKMIHGGTRYLEYGEFGLVREALRERRLLLKLAPHAVRPIPFLIPIYRDSPVPRYLLRTGMALYDLLSFDKNRRMPEAQRMERHHFVSAREALRLEPCLSPEGLRGASVYFDGQAPNPMRLCVEIAKTAAAAGAALANYMRVERLLLEKGRVRGVEAVDRLSGSRLQVRARLTVNCAGVWAVHVMEMLGLPAPILLQPSKGIHVVTRPLGREHALVGVRPNGRRVMVIPWRGKSLIGTTDEFYYGDLDRIRPTRSEVMGLLAEVNEFLPGARLGWEDVEAAYAGARPLIAEKGKRASDLSRRYKIIDHGKVAKRPGMISVLGGKLTTSRGLAEKVVNRAMKLLGREKVRSPTRNRAIGGGDIESVEAQVQALRPAASGLVDEQCLEELVRSYGSEAGEIVERIRREPRLGKRVAPDRPFVWAAVHHAVEHEMATSVADVALRRTDLGNLGDKDGAIGRAVAEKMGRLLELTPEQKRAQLADYLDRIAIDSPARPHADLAGATSDTAGSRAR